MHWKNYLAIVLEIVLAFAHRQLLDRRAFTGQSSSQSRHFTVGTRRDLRRVSLKASKTVRSVYGHVKQGVHIVNILLRRVGKTKNRSPWPTGSIRRFPPAISGFQSAP